MIQSKFILSAIFAFSLMLAGAMASFGQGEVKIEPSYEVSLQLVIGSGDAAQRTDLPANLSTISKELKSTFAFTNYRLAGTFLGRISNTGNFEYKSTTNIFGQEIKAASQSFLDWSMNNFRSGPTPKGPEGFQVQGFRFGAQVPVVTGTLKDANGKENSTINYENIGLSLNRVSLPENMPTLIGTLNLPDADGTIFLVMTVRFAE